MQKYRFGVPVRCMLYILVFAVGFMPIYPAVALHMQPMSLQQAVKSINGETSVATNPNRTQPQPIGSGLSDTVPINREEPVYVATSQNVARTFDFSAESPTWEAILPTNVVNNGVATGVYSFILDPFHPETSAWTQTVNGIWRTDTIGIQAEPSWFKILDNQIVVNGTTGPCYLSINLLKADQFRSGRYVVAGIAEYLNNDPCGNWVGITSTNGNSWTWSKIPECSYLLAYWTIDPEHGTTGGQYIEQCPPTALTTTNDGKIYWGAWVPFQTIHTVYEFYGSIQYVGIIGAGDHVTWSPENHVIASQTVSEAYGILQSTASIKTSNTFHFRMPWAQTTRLNGSILTTLQPSSGTYIDMLRSLVDAEGIERYYGLARTNTWNLFEPLLLSTDQGTSWIANGIIPISQKSLSLHIDNYAINQRDQNYRVAFVRHANTSVAGIYATWDGGVAPENWSLHTGNLVSVAGTVFTNITGPSFVRAPRINKDALAGDPNCPNCLENNPVLNSQVWVGKPINPQDGSYLYSHTDLDIPTENNSLSFQRIYHSSRLKWNDSTSEPFGLGWTHNFNIRLFILSDDPGTPDHNEATQVSFQHSNGPRTVFQIPSTSILVGTDYASEAGFLGTLRRLTEDVSASAYKVTLDQSRIEYYFDTAGYLTKIQKLSENVDTGSNSEPVTFPTVALTYQCFDGQAFSACAYDSIISRRLDKVAVEEMRLEGVSQTLVAHQLRWLQFDYDNALDPVLLSPSLKNMRIKGISYWLDSEIAAVASIHYNYTDDALLHLSEFVDPTERTWSYIYENATEGGVRKDLLTRVVNPQGYITEKQIYEEPTTDPNASCSSAWNCRVLEQWQDTANGVQQRLAYFEYDYHATNQEMMDLNAIVCTDSSTICTLSYDANDHRTLFVYDTSTRQLQITAYVSNGKLYWIKQSYNDEHLPTLTLDSENRLTSRIWVNGNLKSQLEGYRHIQTDVMLLYQKFTYNSSGAITSVTYVDTKSASSDRQAAYEYDSPTSTLLEKRTEADGAITSYFYTLKGYLQREVRHLTVPTVIDVETLYCYDDYGNIKRIVANRQSTFNCLSGRSTDFSDENVTTDFDYDYLYDTNQVIIGQTVTVVDQYNRVQVIEYDPAGRIKNITRNKVTGDNTPDVNLTTEMTYDSAGQLETVTDPLGRITKYEYDFAGRPKTITQNWTGNNLSDPDADLVTQFEYDSAGDVIKQIDSSGVITQVCYDNLHRIVLQITNPSDVYDCTNLGTNFDILPAGLLDLPEADLTDQNLFVFYRYDAVGNVIQQTTRSANGYAESIENPEADKFLTTFTVYDELNRPIKIVANAKSEAKLGDANPVNDPRSDSYTESVALAGDIVPEGQLLPDRDLITQITYDGFGAIAAKVDPQNNLTVYCYDELNRVEQTVVNPSSGVDAPEYCASTYRGTTSSELTADTNLVSSATYDEFGRIKTATDPIGRIITYDYDNLDRVVTQMIDGTAIGDTKLHKTETLYDQPPLDPNTSLYGVVVTDEYLWKTRTDYDRAERQVAVIGNYQGNGTDSEANLKTKYTYDKAGRVITQTDPIGNETEFAYDQADRLTKTTDPRDKSTCMAYDKAGNLTVVVDPSGHFSTFQYDRLNRQHIATTYLNDVTTCHQGYVATLPSTDTPLTSITEYDIQGRVKLRIDPKVVDQNQRRTCYIYDDVNRLWGVVENISQEHSCNQLLLAHTGLNLPAYPDWNLRTNYFYSKDGSQQTISLPVGGEWLPDQSVVNPIGTITYTFDKVGNRTQVQGTGNELWQYAYDKAGRVKQTTDPKNVTKHFGFDALNQIKDITYGGGQLPNVSYNYERVGDRLVNTVSNGQSTIFEYDSLGRIRQVTDAGQVVAYDYTNVEAENRVTTKVTMPGSKTIEYDYVQGVLKKVKDWDAATTDVDYDYYDNNQLKTMTLPNGVLVTFGYDEANRLTSIEYKKGDDIIAQFSYQLDEVGNRVIADEIITEAADALQLQSQASTNATPDTIGVAHGSSENPELPLTYALRNSNNAGPADIITEAGSSDYRPIVGDWDGNGTDTIGYYRPSDGRFFLFNKLNPSLLDTAISFSIALTVMENDVPIVGDWDGDGQDSVGVYRAATGIFYLQNGTQDNGAIDQSVSLGAMPGELPVAGDWNGDGVDTLGLYNPTSATFKLSDSFDSNQPDYVVSVEIEQGKPFAGDWDGDGKSGIGLLLDPQNGNPNSTVYLWNSVTTSEPPSVQFEYGMLNEYPLAGVWGTPPPITATEVHSQAAPTFLPEDVTPYPNESQPTSTPTAALTTTETSEPQTTGTPIAETLSSGDNLSSLNSVPNLSSVNRHIVYMYDGLDRLTSASYEETRPDSSIINYGYGIGYFLSGNRSIFYDNGAFFLYNYNARNQLTTRYYDSSNFTTNSYSYDANGNLTQAVNYLDNATTDFAYDAENRLTTVTDNLAALQTTYTYNPLGERIAQTTQGWVNGAVDGDPTTTNYLLDLSGSLSQVLSETTAGIETAYLNGIGQQKDGQWSYFTQDGLGSIRQLLTSTGDVTYSATYDPYGRVLNDHTTGTNDSKLGFTGEQTDDNGLIYLRARYYSPEMNTFLSRDPVEGVADRFMSRNGYSYVEANPVNYTDPSGRFPWMLFGGLAALAVLLSGDSVQSNRSNTTDAMVGEMALGVLCDACDAALTIRDIHQDGFHPLHLLGLLPIIPASWVNKVIKGLGWTARKAGSVIQRGVYAFAHSGSAFDNLLKLGTSNSNWFRSTTKTIERGLGDVHNLDDLERIEREIVDLPSNERAYGFANDGNAVISLEGSIDQVSWRGEQVEKIYGGTVTHNHPRSGVAPLSPDDIHLAWGANLQEMRAVHRSRSGQIYVFSAKPGANGWDFTMPQLYNALQQARGKILDSLDNHFLQYASTRRNSQLYDYLVYNIDHASLSMAAKELGFQYTVKVLK